MFNQINRLLVLLTLMVIVSASTLVSAQDPQPQGSTSAGLPPIDALASDMISSAKALRNSLTPEQTQAIQAILQAHAADFDAITAELSALKSLPAQPNAVSNGVYVPMVLKGAASNQAGPGRPSGVPEAAQSTNFQALQGAMVKLTALQDTIDAKVSALYTADQQALNKTVTAPMSKLRQMLKNSAAPNAAQAGGAQTNDASLAATAGYCYTAAQYASNASYWAYYGYVNAYYLYYYYGIYNPYYYLYYGNEFSFAGLQNASLGYFDLLQIGSDFHGYVYAGIGNNYNAYAYNNAGTSTALSAYYSTGGSGYAYYAYLYGYYARDNAYQAYAYNYYCYYY